MACALERPRWHAGLLRPVNVVLWVTGLAIAVGSTFLTQGVVGLLPYLGSALFFVGTSRGALSVTAIGSWAQLVSGAAGRQDNITREIHDLKHRMKEVARPICEKKSAVSLVIAEASFAVAREWPGKVDDHFQWYLMCRTYVEAQVQMQKEHPGSRELTVEQRNAVITVLRDSCKIPTDVIAKMLDLDAEQVRSIVASGPGDPQ